MPPLQRRRSSVAVDHLVVGMVVAVIVPLDEGEVVRTTVAPELEDVFALHPEAVETDSMAIRPAQATKDILTLVRVAIVSVGAIRAVVANGDIRIPGCRVQRRCSFPGETCASVLSLSSSACIATGGICAPSFVGRECGSRGLSMWVQLHLAWRGLIAVSSSFAEVVAKDSLLATRLRRNPSVGVVHRRSGLPPSLMPDRGRWTAPFGTLIKPAALVNLVAQAVPQRD
ncbi:hypothetical protein L1887_42039 [Cichorium endivia]|nr:hypothetical protein L1887_42039 [Cichorium endivia]